MCAHVHSDGGGHRLACDAPPLAVRAGTGAAAELESAEYAQRAARAAAAAVAHRQRAADAPLEHVHTGLARIRGRRDARG